jgi:DNA-binding response OmpR family regulator
VASLAVWVVSPSAPVSAQWRKLVEQEGWQVCVMPDLKALVDAVTPHQVGLAVLDWPSLAPAPPRSVQAVKSKAPQLALLLTSSSDIGSERVIELLEAGIDDYLAHATPPGLVLAKLRAHARRILPAMTHEARSIKTPKGDVKIDMAQRGVWIRQKGKWAGRTDLTTIEMKLLALLLERPGVAVERRFILDSLWREKSEGVQPGTIDKHVEALRRKLGKAVGARIQTVYGVGYVYRE